MSVANRRRKLLIVVNDRALRRQLETVFSDLEVTASRMEDDTLAIVRRTEPDVVLLDLGTARAPGAAGPSLELLRQILNLTPDVKLIAITEHDARELSSSTTEGRAPRGVRLVTRLVNLWPCPVQVWRRPYCFRSAPNPASTNFDCLMETSAPNLLRRRPGI